MTSKATVDVKRRLEIAVKKIQAEVDREDYRDMINKPILPNYRAQKLRGKLQGLKMALSMLEES